jgi:mRNA interferase RelE/StbE
LYQIELTRSAARSLKRIEARQRDAIRAKLDEFAQDPRAQRLDIRKLEGRPGYRLRVGDWRVIYEIEDVVRIVTVQKIAPRGSAYR